MPPASFLHASRTPPGAARGLGTKQQHHPATHVLGTTMQLLYSRQLKSSIAMSDRRQQQVHLPTEMRLVAGAPLGAEAAGAEVSMDSRGLISMAPSGLKGGRPPSGMDPSLLMPLKGMTSVGQGAWCSRWLDRLLCPSCMAWHASAQNRDQKKA